MRRLLPHSGDKRIIRKFLWFPKEIDRDWRWLEWAVIEQEFWIGDMHGYAMWIGVRFVDPDRPGSWRLAPLAPPPPPRPPAEIDPGINVGGW